MVAEDYIEKRLKPQISYYNKTAIKNKKIYLRITFVTIILNASIPVLTCFIDTPNTIIKNIIAIVGALATISSSYLLLVKAKDNWLSARQLCEYLTSQLEIFQSQTQPNFTLQQLVIKCEYMMSTEHRDWGNRYQSTNS